MTHLRVSPVSPSGAFAAKTGLTGASFNLRLRIGEE
jgi:hypothetical protein